MFHQNMVLPQFKEGLDSGRTLGHPQSVSLNQNAFSSRKLFLGANGRREIDMKREKKVKGRKNSFEPFEHKMGPQTELSKGCSLAIRIEAERQNNLSSVVIPHDLMALMEKGILFYSLSM